MSYDAAIRRVETMSYRRFDDPKWVEEAEEQYVYPSVDGTITAISWSVPKADWIEITMRMLERNSRLTEEELERIFEILKEETYYGD